MEANRRYSEHIHRDNIDAMICITIFMFMGLSPLLGWLPWAHRLCLIPSNSTIPVLVHRRLLVNNC